MNRRQLMLIPGAALVAEQAFAQAQSMSKAVTGVPVHQSKKQLLKLSRTRSVTKVPKTEIKAAKYVRSIGAYLGLSADQHQQASTILAAARGTLTTIRTSLKPARQSLSAAAQTNDTGAINQASALIGSLTAQRMAAAAGAHAAFYQMLTSAQQAKLTALRS
jgi:hypothetical protein